MAVSKAPGPDGYPVEFYHYQSDLSQNGQRDPKYCTSLFSLVLEPDEDPSLPSILILKSSVKPQLRRREKNDSIYNHPDQTGSIQGRESTSNVRRLITLIDYTNADNLQTAMVWLDAPGSPGLPSGRGWGGCCCSALFLTGFAGGAPYLILILDEFICLLFE